MQRGKELMGLRYSLEESLNQVRSRSDDIVRRREKGKAVLLTASAAGRRYHKDAL